MAIFDSLEKDIAAVYVSVFGRAPEGSGLQYWLNVMQEYELDLATVASEMVKAAKEYPGYENIDDPRELVGALYYNVLGKTYDDDPEGIDFWVERINEGYSAGYVITEILRTAIEDYPDHPATKTLLNRLEVAVYVAQKLEDADVDGDGEIDFDVFQNFILNVSEDPNTVEEVIQEVDRIAMEEFQLTIDADNIVGTDRDDYFDATTTNTLNSDDIIIDLSPFDEDLLEANVTADDIAPTIQNVETIKITGEYMKTGINLDDVFGVKTLKLETKLPNGTADVKNVSSTNVEQIEAGNNIGILKVTSRQIGTRDTVYIKANNADVELTGTNQGADIYDITLDSNKTIKLNYFASAGDSVIIRANGDFTIDNNSTTVSSLTIEALNNSVTVNVNNNQLLANEVTLIGEEVIIDAKDADDVDGININSIATKSAILLNDSGDNDIDLTNARVTEVIVNTDINGGTLNVNQGSVVNLTYKQADLTINTDSAGTLILDVSTDQTKVTTGNNVEALIVAANENDKVTIETLKLDAATSSVLVQGSNDLKISNLDLSSLAQNSEVVVSAQNRLIIEDISDSNSISVLVTGGEKDDNISVSSLATNSTINIYSGLGNDLIDLGNTYQYATITTGSGSDIIVSVLDAQYTITDFEIGKDKLIIHGTSDQNINLTRVSPNNGAYDIDGSGQAEFTLEGYTETDLSNIVQLGYNVNRPLDLSGNPVTVVAGNLDDVIKVDNSSTITTGQGSDIVITKIDAQITINDLSETDKIILTGIAGGGVDLTSVSPNNGAYDIDGSGQAEFTLEGYTETDLSNIVQLGYNGDYFVGAASVRGSKFSDYIDMNNSGGVNFHFDNIEAVDYLRNFLSGTDKLTFDYIDGIDVGGNTDNAIDVNAFIDDAINGKVYVVDGSTSINGDDVDIAVLGNPNDDITFESPEFTQEVAEFIDNVFKTDTGEHYIIVITGQDYNEDGSSNDSLIYFVNGNDNGVTADDIKLIGIVENATVSNTDIIGV